MPARDMEAFGGLVSMTVNSALAPMREKQAGMDAQILSLLSTVADLRSQVASADAKAVPTAVDTALYERLAVAESKLGFVSQIETDVQALNDRVLTVETKASVLSVPETDVRDHLVALSPVQERVVAVEVRLDALTDAQKAFDPVRDRVLTLEARIDQPTIPVHVDHDLRERMAGIEAMVGARLGVLQDAEKTLADLNARVRLVETKEWPTLAAPSVVIDPDLRDRVVALEVKVAQPSASDASVQRLEQRVAAVEDRQATDTIQKDLAVIRERVAVAEVRAFMPGPAGADGKPGMDGKDGRDGVDGLGFDDLSVVQTDERTFTVKAARGERVKDIGTVRVPGEIYRGVWQSGRQYEKGDCVTFGGSEFHCNETTTAKPEDGSKAFTLKVKRGRDGKDGLDATGAAPVVRVR